MDGVVSVELDDGVEVGFVVGLVSAGVGERSAVELVLVDVDGRLSVELVSVDVLDVGDDSGDADRVVVVVATSVDDKPVLERDESVDDAAPALTLELSKLLDDEPVLDRTGSVDDAVPAVTPSLREMLKGSEDVDISAVDKVMAVVDVPVPVDGTVLEAERSIDDKVVDVRIPPVSRPAAAVAVVIPTEGLEICGAISDESPRLADARLVDLADGPVLSGSSIVAVVKLEEPLLTLTRVVRRPTRAELLPTMIEVELALTEMLVGSVVTAIVFAVPLVTLAIIELALTAVLSELKATGATLTELGICGGVTVVVIAEPLIVCSVDRSPSRPGLVLVRPAPIDIDALELRSDVASGTREEPGMLLDPLDIVGSVVSPGLLEAPCPCATWPLARSLEDAGNGELFAVATIVNDDCSDVIRDPLIAAADTVFEIWPPEGFAA